MTADVPSIAGSLAAPGGNGVVSITGSADPGATVEVAVLTAGTATPIGWTTADGSGAWSFATPAAAFGYGTVTLEARSLDAAWNASPWSSGTSFTFADPEAGLRHVGADRAAQLQFDAAHGLDATADLQAVADEVSEGGGAPAVLDIPAGTYEISNTILLASGSYLDAPGVTLEAAADWQRPTPGNPLGYTMLANADYASGTITDHDIQVRNVAFNWNGFNNYGSAAVRFTSAENVLVQGCSFAGGEDGTAFIHCDGAVVNNCTAVATVNYAYDNWDGPTNTVVENSTAEVARFAGIAFTGRGTAATDDAVAANDAAIDNTIIGADREGIDINALSEGSQVNHMFVAGNTVVGPGAGITVTGPGTGELIVGNTLAGSMGQPEIQVANPGLASPADAGLQVQDATIADNDITNATIAAGSAAIVVEAKNAGIFGNSVAFGSAPWDLWIAGSTVDSAGNTLDNWATAALLTTWSTNVVSTDGPGSPVAPTSGQAPYVIAAGTLTMSGAGVLDLRANPDYAGVHAVHLAEGVGQTAYLGAGAGVLVTVAAAAGDIGAGSIGYGAAGSSGGLTIFGAAAADVIDLGTGDDVVVLGGAQETVHGGSGDDTFYIDAQTAGASIDGGTGVSQLVVTGGGSVTLGPDITGITTVKILTGDYSTQLTLNAEPGLTAVASDNGDTIAAGAPNQTLVAGPLSNTLIGVAGGDITFAGRAADLEGDTIENFAFGDTVDVTSVGTEDARFAVHVNDVPGMTTLFVLDGHDGMGVNIAGTLDGTRFHLQPDGGLGVEAVYSLGTYTAGSEDDLQHVLGEIDAGGSDAAPGAGYTLFLGGYLLPGATVALTADLAPVNLAAGGSLVFDGTGHTLNAQSHSGLAVAAGKLELRNLALAGSGGVQIGPGATLELDGGASMAAVFTGIGGTLRLDTPPNYSGTLEGIVGNDLFLKGISASSANIAGGELTIDLTGGGTLDFAVTGAGPGATASVSNDGSGDTIVSVACYLAGTRILTTRGEVPIEHLAIGERVVTLSGAVKPVKWMGRRRYALAQIEGHDAVRPVLIRRGALADGLPRCDLSVSPEHALLLDGVLVPARHLTNGVSVLRRNDLDVLEYYHLELATHDIVFAEGQPAETFADCENREVFDNAADFARLYPDDASPHWTFCAPRVEEGELLADIRHRLNVRAGLACGDWRDGEPGPLLGNLERVTAEFVEGWAQDSAAPEHPVRLEILDTGAVIARVLANRHRDDLAAAGLGSGHHAFSVRLARPLADGMAHRIEVRRAADRMALPGSPGRLLEAFQRDHRCSPV